jgi:hypothetical protein
MSEHLIYDDDAEVIEIPSKIPVIPKTDSNHKTGKPKWEQMKMGEKDIAGTQGSITITDSQYNSNNLANSGLNSGFQDKTVGRKSSQELADVDLQLANWQKKNIEGSSQVAAHKEPHLSSQGHSLADLQEKLRKTKRANSQLAKMAKAAGQPLPSVSEGSGGDSEDGGEEAEVGAVQEGGAAIEKARQVMGGGSLKVDPLSKEKLDALKADPLSKDGPLSKDDPKVDPLKVEPLKVPLKRDHAYRRFLEACMEEGYLEEDTLKHKKALIRIALFMDGEDK